MSIVDINPEEAGKKLKIVSRFPFEIISLFFAAAIVYLFTTQQSLAKEFRDYTIKQGSTNAETIVNSTQKISENTEVLREIKGVLLENQLYLKKNK